MSILVTGAAGFIGSHLTERLVGEGRDVIAVDNFDPFYSKTIKDRNIQSLLRKDNFHFYQVDIRSEDFSLLLSNNNIETIIHLAARAGVRPSLDFPQSYVHYDIEATVNVLEASNRFGVKNIVFGSSSSVYGNIPELPYHEDMKLQEPISPYAAAKLSCELFNHVFSSQYEMNITNLRFFTVYGPRQRPEMGIHKFVRLIANDLPIDMYGDGSSSRDYTYVSDIVDGICLSLENLDGYQTYNLGNSDPIMLTDLIELIMKKMNKKTKINITEMQRGDVDHSLADITKAKRELGYNPKISIGEGITEFINWYEAKN